MLYILLAVAFSVAVSILLKLARRGQVDMVQAVATNYVVAAALAWLLLDARPAAAIADPATYTPLLLLGVILRMIEILRFFDVIYITTRGGPGDSTMVLTLFTYQQNFQFFQVVIGSAAAVGILALSIVVTTFAVRILRRVENE